MNKLDTIIRNKSFFYFFFLISSNRKNKNTIYRIRQDFEKTVALIEV